ncbi:PBipA, plastid GTPase BipA/TypA [Ectocarpus siliculosus]|uniref:PBipA, plastid GTPase BipA/TypA n=1 Tax=Ectocarpus siliculosus TaxID=2880 RepID=D7FV09_ECTSI|nr:PBipA, plastid GTPase BipA/TypA [Ectocarpus siliculosus]|eukprot:CBJ31815.1 PBipA, plastid GTPase BipA/TypA [Ectocarpus siliculosus]
MAPLVRSVAALAITAALETTAFVSTPNPYRTARTTTAGARQAARPGLLRPSPQHRYERVERCRVPTIAAASAPVKAVADEDVATLPLEQTKRDDLRNLAIVAHVDHGKTTLVDAMLQQSSVFRDNEQMGIRVMDSNDQERERGITILAKVEGPKPQTRFVLKKALELGLQAVVVVNKIDRPSARPEYVVDKTFDLFCDLNANDEQSDFQIVYTSAIKGIAGNEPEEMEENMEPLFKAIMGMPKPLVKETAPLQALVANIDYDDFKGKLGVGRIHSGSLKKGQNVGLGRPGEDVKTGKVSELFVFDNLGRKAVEEAHAGDIVMVAGLAQIGIGDTILDPANPNPMVPIAVEEPTVRMTFGVNKSPLAGREGKFLTTRMIRDRLMKELDRNVALRVEETDSSDAYEVSGRGQLHLTVLIENMRREGFELLVGPPTVITKQVDGSTHEPFETVEVQVPDEYTGAVVDLLSRRKGEMLNMTPVETGGDAQMTNIEYLVPTRGMIGLRNSMLTATRGTAVMDTIFDSYRPYAGDIEARDKGSLVAHENGVATPFGIAGAQSRGVMMVSAKDEIYRDMIIGLHQRPGDLRVNICKAKALNNIRSATKSISESVTVPMEVNLDMAVEYIQADELVEVTPTKIRMTKNAQMAGKK